MEPRSVALLVGHFALDGLGHSDARAHEEHDDAEDDADDGGEFLARVPVTARKDEVCSGGELASALEYNRLAHDKG